MPTSALRYAQVATLLARDGYQISASRRLPNKLGLQLRLVTGQVVNIYDTGSVVVQGVSPEPVKRLLQCLPTASAARTGDTIPALAARNSPLLCPPTSVTLPHRPTEQCVDADGYPIRLPGTDAILAMGPPPAAQKLWQNPKTLRHFKNRLRALGYQIRSSKWRGGAWWVTLETGQTLCYRDGGRLSFAPFQRDYQLECLFAIDGSGEI